MNYKKYLSLIRIGVIESLSFRSAKLVIIAGNIMYLIFTFYLWRSIFASSESDVVNGMTFNDTFIYLVLATALFNFMEMYAVWEMGRDIQSGKIVLNILKPIEYRKFLFWSFSGDLIIHFVTTFLPTFLIVYFITFDRIPLGVNILNLMVSVIFAIIINFNIDFFVGTICFYTESIWGINIFKQVIVMLLSGATIPIAFFPEPFKTIVMYLPFQSIYNTPLTILLNEDVDSHKVIILLAIQLFWLLVTTVIVKLFWKCSIKKVTINGG